MMNEKPSAETLSACRFFNGLEQEDLEAVAELCHNRRFEAGDTIFQQGRPGEQLYIICTGRVCLERVTDLGSRKGKVTLALLEEGNAFGAWSVLLGEPHTLMTTAVCLQTTTAVALEVEKLRKLMVEKREFGFGLMERLCFLLRDRLTTMLGALEKLSL